ncbi:MAG: Rrf2 family transcriptional regulator [Flavobacteriales bacterium]|nr:Rrf2 family transcriptional regulator [Flavobacteriales bacterium]
MFSKSCEYGIRAVIYLAANSTETKRCGIKPIAAKLEIPSHFLGKILQKLARENVIHSIKGPNGGFFATEEDASKAMITVVNVLDGPSVFSSCAVGLKECSDEKPCPLHNDIKPFRNALMHSLSSKSIKTFADTLGEDGTYLVV